MNKRCKHIGKDGFHRCGSYAFNLEKDDIDQGDLCDVHYWQAKAQRTWAGLTDEEMENTFIECGGKWNGDYWKIEDADFHPFVRTIEAKIKEKNA